LTLPFEQASEAGSPVIVGVDMKEHSWASVTMAVSFTIPPVDANDDGVAWKDETVGSGVETDCVEAPAINAGVARIMPLAKKKIPATNRAGADLEKIFKAMNSPCLVVLNPINVGLFWFLPCRRERPSRSLRSCQTGKPTR
jgi:hypothetical protein